jgi:hypothetical protein
VFEAGHPGRPFPQTPVRLRAKRSNRSFHPDTSRSRSGPVSLWRLRALPPNGWRAAGECLHSPLAAMLRFAVAHWSSIAFSDTPQGVLIQPRRSSRRSAGASNPCLHSFLRATIGSTYIARLAGTRQAATVIATNEGARRSTGVGRGKTEMLRSQRCRPLGSDSRYRYLELIFMVRCGSKNHDWRPLATLVGFTGWWRKRDIAW